MTFNLTTKDGKFLNGFEYDLALVNSHWLLFYLLRKMILIFIIITKDD